MTKEETKHSPNDEDSELSSSDNSIKDALSDQYGSGSSEEENSQFDGAEEILNIGIKDQEKNVLQNFEKHITISENKRLTIQNRLEIHSGVQGILKNNRNASKLPKDNFHISLSDSCQNADESLEITKSKVKYAQVDTD